MAVEEHHHHHGNGGGDSNTGVYAVLIIVVILILGAVLYFSGVFGPAGDGDDTDLNADIRIEERDVDFPDVNVPDDIQINVPDINLPDSITITD